MQLFSIAGTAQQGFTATNGSDQDVIIFTYGDPALQARIIDGWRQFERDLAEWQPTAEVIAPEGRAPETLPALRIELTGAVTASNLTEFKQRAMAVIGSVNTCLATDQDFADAEKAVKWCKDVETRLAAAKSAALAQTADIDNLMFKDFRGRRISVESAYQGSKVYKGGVQNTNLYDEPSYKAKAAAKEMDSRSPLTGFKYGEETWGLRPQAGSTTGCT